MPLRLAVLILLLPLSSVFAGTDPYPKTPFGRHLKQIVAALENPTTPRIAKMVEQVMDPSMRDAFPMEEHVAFIQELSRSLGRFKVIGVQESSPDQLYLDLKPEKSKKVKRYLVEFNPMPPHGLLGLQKTTYIDPEKIQVEDWSKLHKSLEEMSRDNEFSGVVYVEAGGKKVFSGAYGYANKRYKVKNHLGTLFNNGSITKHFTLCAVMLLVQQGKIKLSDSIEPYFPEFPEEKRAITINQLIRHQSGLTEYWDQPEYQENKHRLTSVGAYTPIIAKMPLAFEPGKGERYSNAGFHLLGVIIERASDMDYYEFMRERIFKPMGMADTDFYPLGLATAPIAIGYTNLSPMGPNEGYLRENSHVLPPIGTPTGTSYTTVADLIRFEDAMRGARFLDKKHTAAFFNLQAADSIEDAAKMPIPDIHGSAGGAPGISAVMVSQHSKGIRIIVLSNYDERFGEDIGLALFRQLRSKS